jgi:uncharacterized membrane protein YvlD (DUF360 family)
MGILVLGLFKLIILSNIFPLYGFQNSFSMFLYVLQFLHSLLVAVILEIVQPKLSLLCLYNILSGKKITIVD